MSNIVQGYVWNVEFPNPLAKMIALKLASADDIREALTGMRANSLEELQPDERPVLLRRVRDSAEVRAAGVEWDDYDRFTKANEKEIVSERLRRVPRELDLTPYQDEEDFALLRAMAKAD